MAGLKGQLGLCLMMLRKKNISHSTIKQRLIYVESTYLVLINGWSLIIFQFSLRSQQKCESCNRQPGDNLLLALPSRSTAGKSTIKGIFSNATLDYRRVYVFNDLLFWLSNLMHDIRAAVARIQAMIIMRSKWMANTGNHLSIFASISALVTLG